jgi:cell division protein FtsI/penicillin-binding protein 2
MSQGFANSCNPYFINLGLKVGGEKLLQVANLFGFGQPMIFAPGLSSDAGTLPSAQELQEPAAVGNFSMGQGNLMVTPVQVACMISAIANDGLLPTARLVKGIYTPGTGVTQNPGAIPESIISPQIAETIKGFMIKTVNEGTGMPAKPVYGGAGGKTSTAETGWVQNGKAINEAWFAGFYPAQSPKYAIVAVCENGTAGGADAGPVFKSIADSLAPLCGFPKVNN